MGGSIVMNMEVVCEVDEFERMWFITMAVFGVNVFIVFIFMGYFNIKCIVLFRE